MSANCAATCALLTVALGVAAFLAATLALIASIDGVDFLALGVAALVGRSSVS